MRYLQCRKVSFVAVIPPNYLILEDMHALFTYEGGYRGTVLHMIMVSWPAVIFQAVLFDDNQRTSSYNIELVNATTKMLQLGFNLDSRDSNEQTVLRINRI